VAQDRRLAGIGALGFVVSLLVAFTLFGPKSGAYSPAETAAFVGQSSTSLVVSVYLFAVSMIGLVALMAYLTDTYLADGRLARLAWDAALLAAASVLVGWGLYLAPSTAVIAGGPAIDPAISYTFISAGFVALFGVGGMLLGAALLVLAIAGLAAPMWIRALTGLAGLAAFLSWAFLLATGWSPNQWLPIPFYLVVVWGLVTGMWLLVSAEAAAVKG
jgi:hypothetical protein